MAINEEETTQQPTENWRWTLASGFMTILLAAAALLLPLVEWAPRGGVVGWLLFLAGMWEFVFGWKRGPDTVGKAAMGSGLVTGLAGLLFVANPLSGYFPVANVVVAWLLLRGFWMLFMALRARRCQPARDRNFSDRDGLHSAAAIEKRGGHLIDADATAHRSRRRRGLPRPTNRAT